MIEIILEISMRCGLIPIDLIGKSRKMPLPAARYRIFGLCYSRGIKQIEIAAAFNVAQSSVSRGITNYFKNSKP